MKQLLKKTAALWIVAALILLMVWVPIDFHADAAGAGSAYLTVELLSMDLGFLCAPGRIEINSGETAAQTLMRFLSAYGYTAYYTGTAEKNYKLGYIASGDKSEAHNGYSSSVKAYPVKTVKKIDIEGKLSPLAIAMLGVSGVEWDPDKSVKIEGFLGAKDLTDTSGWVFSVNNKYVTGSLSDVKLADGDTLRVQFSLAEGRDLGYSFNSDGTVTTHDPDRSRLIKVVADHANNHANSVLYDNAKAALSSMTVTNEEIVGLYNALVDELQSLDVYTPEATTGKPASTTAATTTKKADSTTTTKKADSTTTTKKADSTTTTKKADSTTTTKKADSTTTTKKADSTTTTKKADSTTTTKKADSTTTTKKADSTTTTKSSSTSTTASNSVTAKQYSPLTTAAGSANALLTTVLGETTLPGETTTMNRPEGIVLDYMSKEVPTTEPETTAEDSSDEETTEAAQTFINKLKELRYSEGAVRNVIITAITLVVVAVAVTIFIAKKKNKKTV